MGNRAVITFKDAKNKLAGESNNIGLYLHWHGSDDSVRPFLKYCELKGYRSVEEDETYAFARLAQVVGNFFTDGLSVGVGVTKNLDCENYDNGTYIIKGWQIVGRQYIKDQDISYFECDESSFYKALKIINDAQPVASQLDEALFVKAAKEMVKDVESFRSKAIIDALKKELLLTNTFDTFYLKEDEDGETEVVSVRDKMFAQLDKIANKPSLYSLEAVQELDLETIASIATGYLDNDPNYEKLGRIKTKQVTLNLKDTDNNLVVSFTRDVEVYEHGDLSVFDLAIENFELNEDLEDESYELDINLLEAVNDSYDFTMI